MASKYELAQYLVNLHILIDAQSGTGLNKSTTLLDEYNNNWDLLKTTITKENSNEARPRNDSNFNESGTNPPRDQSRRSSTAGDHGDQQPNSAGRR